LGVGELVLLALFACVREQGALGSIFYEKNIRESRDENGTEIFRIDRFRFLYYEPFFNIKNCQFQLVPQPFSIIFCTL
jgi:hypothetical protein